MAELKGITQLEGGRVAVPLVMLDGNMDVLLNHEIPLRAICLKWSDEFPEAVVLIVHGIDQEKAAELGFQTRSG